MKSNKKNPSALESRLLCSNACGELCAWDIPTEFPFHGTVCAHKVKHLYKWLQQL